METLGSPEMYSSLQRAQLTRAYLHTNSTTHEFLFGALAELVDNARDASSKRIDIYTEPAEGFRGKFMLCFLDDGDGMDRDEVANVIQFGRSIKRKVDQHMIGQYGNGLKSGTMRIARDMILFSKKNNTLNCLFISRTFLEREQRDEVVVPMPSWSGATKEALPRDRNKPLQHEFEVNIITKYSPFKTEKDILAQFDKIGTTGTLVVVFHMKTMDNGEPELDVVYDPCDIRMADPYQGQTYGDDNSVVPERKSFRAYTAVLYLDPKMKIYIQHKKVHTKRLLGCFYKPRMYQFTSTRFKRRSEKEAEAAEQEYKLALEEAQEAEAQDRELREKAENSKVPPADQRKASQKAVEKRTSANMKKKVADLKKKSSKEAKTLEFTFGVNLTQRKCYGVMLYNCGRLIRMYEKVGCQMEGGMKGYGILGVVDVPYLVLEPTHNKQDFADHKEFKSLTRALGEHLDQYWKDGPISHHSSGVAKFWEAYGYVSNKWQDDPSNEPKYLRKRTMDLPIYAQCDKCLKWRLIPFHSSYVGKDLQDNWCCMDNPDPECKKCHLPEKKMNIPKGYLKKDTKSVEEKRHALEEEARKTQEKLSRLAPRPEQQQQTSNKRATTATPVRVQPQPATSQRDPSPPQKRQQATLPRIAPAPTPTPTRASTTPARAPPRPTQTPAQTTRGTPKQNSTTSSRPPVKVAPPVPKEKSPVNLKRTATTPTPEQELPPPKKKKEAVVSKEKDMEWSSDSEKAVTSPVTSPKQQTKDPIISLHGRLCEGRTENKTWHVGTITAVKQQKDGATKVKVKFRDYPKDKFDKWYVYPSPEISLIEEEDPKSAPQPAKPQKAKSPPSLPSSPSVELPSTTTTVETANGKVATAKRAASYASPEPSSPVRSPDTNVSSLADREEMLHKIGESLRTCLAFFVQDNYHMSSDDIKGLSLEQLRKFNVDEFNGIYEKGLETLVTGFVNSRDEAQERCSEMERARVQTDERCNEMEKLRNQAQEQCKVLQKSRDQAEERCREIERQKREAEEQLRVMELLKDEADERFTAMQTSRNQTTNKLLALRRSAMNMIRSLEEAPDLDPEGDDVDRMLEAIAREAQAENQGN